MEISGLFTRVKQKAREYFPDLTDAQLVRAIERNFSNEDLGDALSGDIENVGRKINHQAPVNSNAHYEVARASGES